MIIKKLRDLMPVAQPRVRPILDEAIGEIEHLRAENHRLRGVEEVPRWRIDGRIYKGERS